MISFLMINDANVLPGQKLRIYISEIPDNLLIISDQLIYMGVGEFGSNFIE